MSLAQAQSLVVNDMTHGATAQNMAQSLVGGGVTISNVTYTGAPNAAGTFTGGDGGSLIGFDRGILLGSGSVQTTPTSITECGEGNVVVPGKGVEGPNRCDLVTTRNFTPGDVDLTTLSGKATFDAAVLEFDFVPQFSTVQFTYVFSSDEYNEFANDIFNDTFAFLVNGQNCALVPSTTTPVGVNTINGGDPFGTNAQNPAYYRNNDLDDGGGGIDTEADGLTVVLTCNANVNPNATNHLKLAISDATDHRFDSNVFIQAGSLVSGTRVTTNLSGGGQSGASITVPTGTTATDSATLTGENSSTAGGTVTYTVYSDNTCSTVYADGGTKDVTNGSAPNSDPVMFTQPGTLYWVASYSGDANNEPGFNACGSETVTVEGPGPPATLTLSPDTATNTAGQQHCVTSTVEDSNGNETPNVTVSFSVNGAHTASGNSSTNASGEAQFCYTGTTVGDDTIIATAQGGSNPSDTASKTYVAAAPATLTLSPRTATNTVDTQHCVTATVKDAFGNPNSNTTVRFSVTGSNTLSGSASTNIGGQESFCYAAALPGSDTIRAYADTNGNSMQDGGEPGDVGSKAWVAPASTAGCKITNGGHITASNGDKATFGGNAHATSPPKGNETYQDHGHAQPMSFKSATITAVACSTERKQGSVFGTANVNGQGSFQFRIDVQDLGEPGRNDTYRIRLSNGYDSGQRKLQGGNIQIHMSK